MDIDNMQAGRELDALIAEKVMEHRVLGRANADCFDCDWVIYGEGGSEPVYLEECQCEEWKASMAEVGIQEEPNIFGHYSCCLKVVPEYSTDIAHAWLAVDRLIPAKADNINISMRFGQWRVDFELEGCILVTSGEGATVPLAICRAALKAVAP